MVIVTMGVMQISFSPAARVPTLFDGSSIIWDRLAIVEDLYEKDSAILLTELDACSWGRCERAKTHSSFQIRIMYCPMTCGVHVSLKTTPRV